MKRLVRNISEVQMWQEELLSGVTTMRAEMIFLKCSKEILSSPGTTDRQIIGSQNTGENGSNQTVNTFDRKERIINKYHNSLFLF